MDKKYYELFSQLARSTEVLAERVMELDRENKDEKGEQTAQIMRDDFAQLHDKLKSGDAILTRAEWAKLLVAAMIVANNIDDQIKAQQKVLQGYKTMLIPKLNRINDETETDEEANALADELFKILEDK